LLFHHKCEIDYIIIMAKDVKGSLSNKLYTAFYGIITHYWCPAPIYSVLIAIEAIQLIYPSVYVSDFMGNSTASTLFQRIIVTSLHSISRSYPSNISPTSSYALHSLSSPHCSTASSRSSTPKRPMQHSASLSSQGYTAYSSHYLTPS